MCSIGSGPLVLLTPELVAPWPLDITERKPIGDTILDSLARSPDEAGFRGHCLLSVQYQQQQQSPLSYDGGSGAGQCHRTRVPAESDGQLPHRGELIL